jgi:hypothetical protein
MAKDLCFKEYQPLSFCKVGCEQMCLTLHQQEVHGDDCLERIVTISCSNEAICRAARQRTFEEIQSYYLKGV